MGRDPKVEPLVYSGELSALMLRPHHPLHVLIARGLDRLQGAPDLQATIWQRTVWLIGAIPSLAGALVSGGG